MSDHRRLSWPASIVIANVALETIGCDFGEISFGPLSWILNAYNIISAAPPVSAVVWPTVADGRKAFMRGS